jgi:hypothetical protein
VMAAFCLDKHYYVVSIKFDSSSEDIINSVEVYDSLKVVRKDNVKMDLKNRANTVLKVFQRFLAEFVYYDKQHIKTKLISNPTLYAKYSLCRPSPCQLNTDDCSLFAICNLIHVATKSPIVYNTFLQNNITNFRKSLYKLFTNFNGAPDPKVALSPSLIKYLFPTINDYYLDMHHPHIRFFYQPQSFPSPTKSDKTLSPLQLWTKSPTALKSTRESPSKRSPRDTTNSRSAKPLPKSPKSPKTLPKSPKKSNQKLIKIKLEKNVKLQLAILIYLSMIIILIYLPLMILIYQLLI